MTAQTTPNSSEQYETSARGIDAHAKFDWVSRQVESATPQPVQKMVFEELLLFVAKQQKLAGRICSCHEAVPSG